MSVLVSNSCLLPTGGLRNCWFSAIQRWKLNGLKRGCWSMSDPFRRCALFGGDGARRAVVRELEAARLKRSSGGGLLGLGEFQERPADRAADLAEQLLPVFLV